MKIGNLYTTVIVLFAFSINVYPSEADLVTFSFNRPIQLYAFLESAQQYITGIGTTTVMYRASNHQYEQEYHKVLRDFPHVRFIKQGPNPARDFKTLTINATFQSPNEYIIFAVDDIIVKDYVDLSECIIMLENTNAYGVYLRMAPHLTHAYPAHNKQRLPSFKKINEDVFSWSFLDGQHDWQYPHTVDMTLYRKKDIENDFHTMNYTAPNTLEAEWSSRSKPIMNRIGLCYKQSKILNIPLNQVHTCGWQNPHMNYLSAEQLLKLFQEGKRIDIKPLFRMNNQGAHIDYVPTFIPR